MCKDPERLAFVRRLEIREPPKELFWTHVSQLAMICSDVWIQHVLLTFTAMDAFLFTSLFDPVCPRVGKTWATDNVCGWFMFELGRTPKGTCSLS